MRKADIHAEYISRIFYRIWTSYVVKCSTTNSWLNTLLYIECSYSIEYSWNIFCMYRWCGWFLILRNQKADFKAEIHAEYVSRIFYRIWISYVVKCSTTNSWLNTLLHRMFIFYGIFLKYILHVYPPLVIYTKLRLIDPPRDQSFLDLLSEDLLSGDFLIGFSCPDD